MTDQQKLILAGLLGLVLLLVVWGGAFALEQFLLVPLATALGWEWVDKIPLTLIFVCGFFALPARWTAIPMTYHIRGSTEIDQTSAYVWDVIAPRTRDSYWSATITRSTIDPSDPSRIEFHFEGTAAIGAPSVLRCVIIEEEPFRRFAYRALNGDEFPMFAGDVVRSEYTLANVEGRTRVTFVETLDRLQLVAIPLLLWMNPCQDALIRLKAVCEGVADTSWMGRNADKLRKDEAARTVSTYQFFKWVALAFIPLAFTLAMISFIGSATAH